MSETTLLEKQSKKNVSIIYDTYKISTKEAKGLTALSLDATLFNGHIDLKNFSSLTNLYIFKPFNKKDEISSGITSLDLSSNKDFIELYFGSKAVPNFNSITLAHSNQIGLLCFDGDINVLRVFKEGAREAFFRNAINRINAESDKDLKLLLGLILLNDLHASRFDYSDAMESQIFLKARLLKDFRQKEFA